jgi:preprotein translocase subunit SecF
MDKKLGSRAWKSFRAIKPIYFLILFLAGCGLTIYALRYNNLTMVNLRTALYQADKNDTNVSQKLDALQSYVTSHMNTDLSTGPNAAYPPIQLQYTYQRLETAEQQRVAAINSKIYTEAQVYCQQQNPVSYYGKARVPCVEQYVEQQHGATAQPIASALYEFDFVSPSWSPDLAGWSLLASILLFILFVTSWVTRRWSGK